MAGNNTRIQKETQRLLAEPCEGISATPYEDNMRYFNVVIAGPLGTPYEGGMFRLELFLPAEYPMGSPKVRFLTKIYHPNVDKLGTTVSLTHCSWYFPSITHTIRLSTSTPNLTLTSKPTHHTQGEFASIFSRTSGVRPCRFELCCCLCRPCSQHPTLTTPWTMVWRSIG